MLLVSPYWTRAMLWFILTVSFRRMWIKCCKINYNSKAVPNSELLQSRTAVTMSPEPAQLEWLQFLKEHVKHEAE